MIVWLSLIVVTSETNKQTNKKSSYFIFMTIRPFFCCCHMNGILNTIHSMQPSFTQIITSIIMMNIVHSACPVGNSCELQQQSNDDYDRRWRINWKKLKKNIHTRIKIMRQWQITKIKNQENKSNQSANLKLNQSEWINPVVIIIIYLCMYVNILVKDRMNELI